MTVTHFVQAAGPLLPGLTLGMTLLLLAGGLLALFLRRRSAAARHFVWMLAFCGGLALLLLAPVAPQLPVTIWRAPVSEHSVPAARGRVGRESAGAERPQARNDVAASTVEPPQAQPLRSPIDLSPLLAVVARPPLFLAWLAGCLVVLAWCLLGHAGLARLARRAEPVHDAEWRELLDDARTRQGVMRPVRLARSAAVGSPVTWGWLRPLILLPEEAGRWPVELRRAALQHELAHVARRDYLTQVAATVACAFYWFNPLAWLALRCLRAESEQACDDLVLAGGTPAGEYATHLLQVARGARAFGAGDLVALSMARSSELERRILAVLDDTRTRRTASRRVRWLAAAALVVILVPLAGLRPAPARSASEGTTREEEAAAERASKAASRERKLAAERSARATTREEKLAAERADEAAFASTAPNEDATIDRQLEATAGEQLDLDLDTGGSVELHGWNQDRVRFHGELGGKDWASTHVTVERTNHGVRVHTVQAVHGSSFSTSHRFTIDVPRNFDVRLRSAGGDFEAADMTGLFRGETGGGEIHLARLKGEAQLSTGGGDIEVSDSDLSGSISTGGGEVRLSDVRGPLRCASGSGPVIWAERPESDRQAAREREVIGSLDGLESDDSHDWIKNVGGDLRGALHIDKAGGDVGLDEAPHGAVIVTGGGHIHVGRSAGFVSAHTGGGDIDIGPVRGSVQANTGAGDISVRVSESEGGEQNIDISDGSGDITLDLPADFDARFDLETAYTRGFAEKARIDSPWPLERHEPLDWDDQHGTPRRYVRAEGQVGSGRAVVRVRTVNGCITLRRGGRTDR